MNKQKREREDKSRLEQARKEVKRHIKNNFTTAKKGETRRKNNKHRQKQMT